jgi:hypothetical protein
MMMMMVMMMVVVVMMITRTTQSLLEYWSLWDIFEITKKHAYMFLLHWK